MKRFYLTKEAAADIREIWEYIARDSVRSARRVRLELFRIFERLALNPGLGHKREDLTNKPLLFWPNRSYLIVYDSTREHVQIVRVLHAARDVERLL